MTRNGKIARLAKEEREKLNLLLKDGHQGPELLQWLNSQPKVKKMVKEQFLGVPITKQNLSEWRNGGYRDWLRSQQAFEWIAQRTESGWLRTEDGFLKTGEIHAGLACAAAVELTLMMQELVQRPEEKVGGWESENVGEAGNERKDEGGNPPSPGHGAAWDEKDVAERWKGMRQVLRELSRLRRDEDREARTAIQRWKCTEQLRREEATFKKEEDADLIRKRQGAMLAMTQVPEMAKKMFEDSEMGRHMAAQMLELSTGIERGLLSKVYPKPPGGWKAEEGKASKDQEPSSREGCKDGGGIL